MRLWLPLQHQNRLLLLLALGHVDPTWLTPERGRCGGDSHPGESSLPGSVGLARAHPLTKTEAMRPSRRTWSSYRPPYPFGRWSSDVVVVVLMLMLMLHVVTSHERGSNVRVTLLGPETEVWRARTWICSRRRTYRFVHLVFIRTRFSARNFSIESISGRLFSMNWVVGPSGDWYKKWIADQTFVLLILNININMCRGKVDPIELKEK